MKDNEHEIPALKELARGLEDNLSLKTPNPRSQDPGLRSMPTGAVWPNSPPTTPLPAVPVDPWTGDRIRRRNNPCKNLELPHRPRDGTKTHHMHL